MKTEKEVRITVRGTQYTEGEQPQTIELITDGTYEKEDDTYRIRYTESEMTDMAGVQTCFTVCGDEVILTRTGNLESEMVFRVGEKTESLYDVGVGALLLGVSATRVEIDLHEQGGSVSFDYAVELEHAPIGRNTYQVIVSPHPQAAEKAE
jgi:uncharacterized beta-barrel protein YwiB (DUF1934 family)